MNEAEQEFEGISDYLVGACDLERGKWFGMPSLKKEGKTIIAMFRGELVVKLTGEGHASALKLKGAHLFDPSEKGHAMKEWVQIPYLYSEKWMEFAEYSARHTPVLH